VKKMERKLEFESSIDSEFRHAEHTTRGHMWPAEAFNLARKTPIFVHFGCFFDKNTL